MSRTNHLALTDLRVAAGEEWQTRTDVWLLLRMSAGLGYWRNDDRGYQQTSPGDVLLVFPSTQGTFLASTLGDVEIQVIAIDLGLLCGVLTVSECRALAEFAARNREKVILLPRDHPFSVRLGEICRTQRANALISRLKLLQLFAELIDEGLQAAVAAEPEFSDSRSRMKQLIQQMPEAELMRCSVAELAKRLCCSQRHLRRLFQNEVGISFREKQKRLRLERARHLLEHGSGKIIDIALDAGYQSLSLFNVMFKERFKMTPSQWRARVRGGQNNKGHSGGKSMTAATVGFLAAMLVGAPSSRAMTTEPAAPPPSPGPSAQAATTNTNTNTGPRFTVTGYRVYGNTLLSVDTMTKALMPHTGDAVDLETIRRAVADLVLAYRVRGYATVGVSLPQQQITNGLVTLQVREGRLSDVVVVNNEHFSSNNVMRALPSLQPGLILNSKYFQAELDQANANRDRQIYPQIQPGPDPGTSTLVLKVKDRMPLHGRLELNNYETPNTPDLRLNAFIEYDNLWQLEHAIGFQYGFTPQEYKAPHPDAPTTFLDRPLIAYYNGFYRMPLLAPQSVEGQSVARPTQFGYNEATRQFSVPPPALIPELYFFGNRSTTDSALKTSPRKLVVQTPVTTIYSEDARREFTETDAIGFRINWPVVQREARVGLSAGFDFRHYNALNLHTNIFTTISVIPPANPNDPPQVVTGQTISSQVRETALTYFPFVFRVETGVPDKLGQTTLSLGTTYNIAIPAFSDGSEFEKATGSKDSTASFLSFNGSITRDQKIYEEWRVLFRVDGQTATEPLFTNEQYALGGVSSVRGYAQGESFGDAGWRVSVEPRTPAFNFGKLGPFPILGRFSFFFDYGHTYLFDPLGRPKDTTLAGAGAGMSWTLGRNFDLGATVAWPLYATTFTERAEARLYFTMAAQF